jgi:hypothetical protein
MLTDIPCYTNLSRALHSLGSVEEAVGEDLLRNTTSIITGNSSFFTRISAGLSTYNNNHIIPHTIHLINIGEEESVLVDGGGSSQLFGCLQSLLY